jgi:hypothetical protein
MKLGREPDADPKRLDVARRAIGDDTELFVDANGAFTAKDALGWAERYADEWNVSWFEEPVSSGDFDGLRMLREHGPGGLDIAAGEYAYTPEDARNIVECVDVLQLDVTRCLASPACSRRVGSRTRTGRTSRRTVRRRSPRTRSARSSGAAISSTSTTTSGSRKCSSTDGPSCATARCIPTARVPATGSS